MPGKRFVPGQDLCVNRCCQTNPCLQGGYSEEICNPTTVRFNCICPDDYTGQRCEKIKPRSCKNLATNGAKISGMHFLYDSQNNHFPVYSNFDFEAGNAWTLIQSFSLRTSSSIIDLALIILSIHLIPKWRKIQLLFCLHVNWPLLPPFQAKYSFEFCRWDRGNKGQLTMRQNSNCIFRHFGIRCMKLLE